MEQWKTWQGKYTLLPYIRTIRSPGEALLPLVWDRFWRDASSYSCILESGKGGRYTIAGLHPAEVIEGKGREARIWSPDGEDWTEQARLRGAPIEVVRSWLGGWTAPRPEGYPDCNGGAVGFWSYDMARSLEKLPELAADDLGWPDYLFQRYERLWIADHRQGTVHLAVHAAVGPDVSEDGLAFCYREAERAADEMERQWRDWCRVADDPETLSRLRRMRGLLEEDRLEIDVEKLPGLTTSLNKEGYQDAVRRVQAYIGQGDAFQVNLAIRQSLPVETPAEQLYEWLRIVNPSPYMGMLRTPGFSLVSASPELLVKLDRGKLSARPIAGTRRRGRTPEEDRAMEDELLSSEKERAEHIMLVDLERNDLGRVAAYGTVKVPELLTIERYSHVMHLVSQVEARLAPGKDALDVAAAMFPGGTITGAPKIRTMEIIEELEPVRRGPYTGSMGWIDYAGNMEFNIIIRTIAVTGGVCHIQAGAGIVIDSDPEREFYECLNKAKALWKAVQYGQRFAERAAGRVQPPV
ncbi:anthranilate synthase component I family protein [Cohnella sp. CFH 77786]|nr:anthranilate synthase component I family protein [Cohnella sp. CFH 77786]MBW5449008.1 anthranilate synthase component I family protein [Cohnella sp. CFH 77786]